MTDQEPKKEPDPDGWWKGVVLLASLVAIGVLGLAGLRWAVGL